MTVNIIIPTFLGADYLNRFALPSIANQDWTDWETIIVDDGSTDETEAVVSAWLKKDQRFRYLRHETNLGLAAALNTGLKAASAEIIAFLEQDDIWLPNKLSQQLHTLANKQLATCNFFYFDPLSKQISGAGGGNFSTLIARRHLLDKIFPLPEDSRFLGIEDGLVAGRLADLQAQGKITNQDLVHLSSYLTLVAKHPDSLSGHGQSRAYIARYQAATNYFAASQSKKIRPLKRRWFWGKYLNLILAAMPDYAAKFLRQQAFMNGPARRLVSLKKSADYQAAAAYLTRLSRE